VQALIVREGGNKETESSNLLIILTGNPDYKKSGPDNNEAPVKRVS
jgi:hypothetical protein